MKETMDGAAKNADKVAKQILPDRPHHLSVSFDRKFPKPESWWFTGKSAPLQYMTYISDAERGILSTRAAFEICEEPPQMPTKVLAKGEVKKKLSLMDYQNKKKSASPTADNGLAAKVEAKTNGALYPKTIQPPKDEIKRGDVKAVEKTYAAGTAEMRSEKPKQDLNGDRTKTSRPLPPPEAENRKRAADTDGKLPPQKRLKEEAVAPKAENPRPLKQGPREGATERVKKEVKSESLHGTANGSGPLVSDRDRENTASPRSTIQVVNGSRPRSDSSTSTPRKPEALGRSSLPDLLSPLHPSLFETESGKQVKPKKKPTEKASKAEDPSPIKKAKKPLKIPPLLSPTLPPVVEEALAFKDTKQAVPKTVSSQPSTQPSDSQNSARKTIVAASRIPTEQDDKPSRPSKIVTFKLKKGNAKRAKELLSLPSKSAKDALKKERSGSTEGTPPPAKKRPRPADDTPQEPAVSKRTKTSAELMAAKTAKPTTPLKQGAIAMSRVTSNQSQGNTPGTTTGLTPGTSERPPTRSEPLDPKTLAMIESYKEQHASYQKLGSRLKHQRDDILRDHQHHNHRDGGAAPTMTPANERRAAALHFEMVLAYMIAFHALNQARTLERRACDIAAWESLLPHLAELKSRVQGNRALKALAVQMHVLCLEQIVNALGTLDPASAMPQLPRWAKHTRTRAAMWSEAAALWERVEDARMKTLVGPWTGIEEAVLAALGIMRRWADREGVRWQPEIELKGEKEKEKGKEVERERERERDRGREGDRGRDGDRPRDGDRARDRMRERERDRDRDRDRDRPLRPPLNGIRG